MSKNIRKIIDTINVHEGYPFTYKVDFKLSMELVKIVTSYKRVIDPITKNTSWSIPVDTTIEDFHIEMSKMFEDLKSVESDRQNLLNDIRENKTDKSTTKKSKGKKVDENLSEWEKKLEAIEKN